MNRVFGEKQLNEKEASVYVRTSSKVADQGPLMIGECPIVIKTPEDCEKGSEWGYGRAKEILMERGMTEAEAHTVATEFKCRQYLEMMESIRKPLSPESQWN